MWRLQTVRRICPGHPGRAPSARGQMDRHQARRPRGFSLEPQQLTARARKSDTGSSSAVGSGPARLSGSGRIVDRVAPDAPLRALHGAGSRVCDRHSEAVIGGVCPSILPPEPFRTQRLRGREAACASTSLVIFETYSSVKNSGKGCSGPGVSLMSPFLRV